MRAQKSISKSDMEQYRRDEMSEVVEAIEKEFGLKKKNYETVLVPYEEDSNKQTSEKIKEHEQQTEKKGNRG